MSSELLYIADPMCSWCWGFSPVIDAVKDHFQDQLPVRVLMGGLRPGTTEPMVDGMKADISGHWKHVQQATGQPFDLTFFDREGFVYDTEPASRAVVAVRNMEPTLVFEFLKKVQEAFYAMNRDVTDPDVLAAIAEESGQNREAFRVEIDTEETITETWMDFETSRRLGVTGFPTLLAGSDEGGYEIITAGFRKWEAVRERIEGWKEKQGADIT
jgi:putative protein-disulfide isomerase